MSEFEPAAVAESEHRTEQVIQFLFSTVSSSMFFLLLLVFFRKDKVKSSMLREREKLPGLFLKRKRMGENIPFE